MTWIQFTITLKNMLKKHFNTTGRSPYEKYKKVSNK